MIFDALQVFASSFATVWFIILPPLLYWLFKSVWLRYVEDDFWDKDTWVLLEIIPPRDVEKSPKIIEALFLGISGIISSPTTYEEFYLGQFNKFVSFEIVSTEGIVHFYIKLPQQFRHIVESHLYAQYPDIDIMEAPDYVDDIPKLMPNKEWDLWGTDFFLVNDDAIPIRTYRDFEEDVTGKMIDPLAALLEAMGRAGPNQHIWLQYIIQPIKEGKTGWYAKGLDTVQQLAGRKQEKATAWQRFRKDVGDVAGGILPGFTRNLEYDPLEQKKEEQPLEFRLTPGEKDLLSAVERNIGKNMFNVKMRYIYLGKKGPYFDKTHISSTIGAIKQFADQNTNSFAPFKDSKTRADYIQKKPREDKLKRKILGRYKGRAPSGHKFVLSTEELATVFHMPDMSVVAPSVRFVDARRGGPPSNLPIN